MGVPDDEEVGDRWSVDHLFLDQDGIPTLVEVKRGTDTRIRREVVGQMLDYAANAVSYWSIDTIIAKVEAASEESGKDINQQIAELLDTDQSDNEAVVAFWEAVKTNLKAGRIRLVFVADVIPQELRRVVEFLNEQMDPAEVLAVEIKQYVGDGIKTLVPRVVGQTAEAQKKKTGGTRQGRKWDEPSFFAELEKNVSDREFATAKEIYSWAQEKMPDIFWGMGKDHGSMFPGLTHVDQDGKRRWYQIIGLWSSGYIEFHFQYLKNKPRFIEDESRTALLNRFNTISSINLPPDSIGRRSSQHLAAIANETHRAAFVEILNWFVEEVNQS